MKTTWHHGGSPLYITTQRKPGQTDEQVCWAHVTAVLAAWHISPPDTNSTVTTTWLSGGREVIHKVTYFGNDIGDFAMALYEALVFALDSAPMD